MITTIKLDNITLRLQAMLKERFQDEASGHDIYHLFRVDLLARRIQAAEGGNNLVICVAALVHDLHRILGTGNKTYCSPKNSLPEVEKLIEPLGLDQEIITKVLHCVEYHEEYNFSEDGKHAIDLETLILQDADNLDAMGAIGIGRSFAFMGAHGKPLWLPDVPVDRPFYDESEMDISTIHHFYHKLLKLKDNMNTATGKQLAIERNAYMERFLEEFLAEWEGKR